MLPVQSFNKLQLPFLNVETSENRKKMTNVINGTEIAKRLEENVSLSFANMGLTEEDIYYLSQADHDKSPDACLIRAYMKSSKGLHVRKTLDQSHYSMLPSTEERDIDQVLLKRCKDKRFQKVVMVDQLWLWMFDGMCLIKVSITDI